MGNTLKNTFIFCFGAGVGSLVTWKLLHARYEQMVREDIASIKEAFSKRKSNLETKIDNNKKEPDSEDLPFEFGEKLNHQEYCRKIQDGGYINYSDMSKNKKDEDEVMTKPYVIAPEEFGENHDYQQISLTYYSDGVLTDEDNDPVENVEETVGRDSLNHFGEYEDDSVFVRNDVLKAEYEILLDQRKYEDVRNKYPHQLEE